MCGNQVTGYTFTGSISSVQGSSITARIPQASVGDLCWITSRNGSSIIGQVIAFQDESFNVALFE